MLMLLHIIAYYPSEREERKARDGKNCELPSILSVYCVCRNWIIIESHTRKAFQIHNRMNSFMLLTSPFAKQWKILSSSWKNEEAEKSHKISGKNNFLCLWYRWWWCMIECLCYRQYKVKHKNMFRHKIHRFYFKSKWRNRMNEGRIMEWCGDNFSYDFSGKPVCWLLWYLRRRYGWCYVLFYESEPQ